MKHEEHITFQLSPDSDPISFGCWEAAIQSLKDEIEPLEWLRSRDIRNVYKDAKSLNKAVRDSINKMQQCLEYAGDSPDGARAHAIDAANSIHADSTTLLASSPVGRFVLELQKSHDDLTAAAAAFHLLGHKFELVSRNNRLSLDPAIVEGIARASSFRHDRAPEIARQKMDETTRRGEEVVQAIQTAEESLEHRIENYERNHENMIALHLELSEIARNSQQEIFAKLCDDATARLGGLEDLYREKLALLEPVQYWKRRSTRQRWAAMGWGALLAVTLGSGGWYLLSTWKETFAHVIEADQPQYWMLGIVGILAAILAFILAFIGRLTMSAFHLATDASERAVMAETYLALLQGEHIENEKDRQLILHALFRPSNTGLVKEAPSLPKLAITGRAGD